MLSLMFWRDWSLSYRNAKIWARCRWGFCLSSPNFPLSSGTWIKQETESTLSSVSLPGPLLASFNCHCGSPSLTLDKLYCKRKSWSKRLTHKLSLARTCEKTKILSSHEDSNLSPSDYVVNLFCFSLSIYSSIQDTINIFQLATCFSHIQWSGICPNSYISL